MTTTAVAQTSTEQAAAWIRELDISTTVSPQVVLHGNIRDRYLVPGPTGPRLTDLLGVLWSVAEPAGYPCLVVVDPLDGMRSFPPVPAAAASSAAAAATAAAGRDVQPNPQRLTDVGDLLRTMAVPRWGDPAAGGHGGPPPAPARAMLVLDYASRLRVDAGSLSAAEHRLFAAAEKASHEAVPLPGAEGSRYYNQVVWVTASERDLPVWLTAHNSAIRRIAVPQPDFGERATACRLLLERSHEAFQALDPAEQTVVVNRLAAATDGLGLRNLWDINQLVRRLRTPLGQIEDAARSYQLGVVDTPWKKPHLRDRLVTAATTLGTRVMGQQAAVQRSVDIVMRAAMGLSGAQGAERGSRPRGILFFAGPSGVGKTELAKAITELVFGDESAYIRFDMSEFSAEHASDRLIGAPPGYVGHDAGGELTNAVRQRPFSLVLFDEIEKAHPRILDKFLQILEDGRLTDGAGSTTYFTETLLVFTSNLGIYVDAPGGGRRLNVTEEMEPAEAEERIRAAISRHFTEVLNRPELLNRLGDNIVVFDRISRPVAEQIFDHLLVRIVERVHREHGVTVSVAADVRRQLLDHACGDLSKGGRGIGSALETSFVNPLARELFLRRHALAPTVEVVALGRTGASWEMTLS
jgi:energy-coupling factor transporter ATP-binding protein EcfA2